MTHDEIIAVIAAHRDGKKVQFRHISRPEDDWHDLPDPSWDFTFSEYRIKPEPIVAYAVISESGDLMLFKIKECAEKSAEEHNTKVITLTEQQ